MNAADIIRDSIAEVEHLRQSASRQDGLAAAISTVKGYQSRRFAATYRDLIAGGPFQRATTFFLEELYGDTNYSRRDAQSAVRFQSRAWDCSAYAARECCAPGRALACDQLRPEGPR